jgi:ubiquinone/menaquinone biosynthesis C-methylase UbiE
MARNTSRSELCNTWELAAPGWAKWEQAFSAGLSAATDALIDMAAIRSGMRVLDLACGAGTQSIQAAKRADPDGRVVAVDISPTMLEHVRRNASADEMLLRPSPLPTLRNTHACVKSRYNIVSWRSCGVG